MKVENTLIWNRLLQFQGYPITTYVYTSNEVVRQKALEAKCIPREVKHRNKYGLPLLSSIMQDLRSISNSSYIGYINSDILIHPDSFSLLKFMTDNRFDYNITGPVCSLIIWLLMIRLSLLPEYVTIPLWKTFGSSSYKRLSTPSQSVAFCEITEVL